MPHSAELHASRQQAAVRHAQASARSQHSLALISAPMPPIVPVVSDSISLPVIVLFLVTAVVLAATFRGSHLFDPMEVSCPASAIASYTGIFIGGAAFGCSLLLLLAMQFSPSMRNNFNSRMALLAYFSIMVHSLLTTLNLTPVVCIAPLGGAGAGKRPQLPLQWMFWACTTTPLLVAMGRSSRLPPALLRWNTVVFVALLTFGNAATFSDMFPLWVSFVVLAALLAMAFLVQVSFLYRAVHDHSINLFTRRLALASRPFAVCFWGAVPLLWILGQASLLTPEQEWMVWPVLDFCGTGSLALLLVLGSFRQQASEAQETQVELAMAETLLEQSQDTRDSVARRFMRWALHELRGPLQGALLAVEELRHGRQGDSVPSTAAPAVAPLGSSASSITPSTDSQAARPFFAATAPATDAMDICINVSGFSPDNPASSSYLQQQQQQQALASSASASSSTSFETGGPHHEAGAAAVSSIKAVSRLLDSFLDLSILEDGRAALTPMPVPVRGWLDRALFIANETASAKGVRLLTTIDSDVPPVIVMDANKLRQALSVYLSNALQFSDPGTEVRVRLQLLHPHSSSTLVSVPLQAAGRGTLLLGSLSLSSLLSRHSRRANPSDGASSSGSNHREPSPIAVAGVVTGAASTAPSSAVPSASLSPQHQVGTAAGAAALSGQQLVAQRDPARAGRGATPLDPARAVTQLHLRVSVEDSGPGIAAEELPKLFQPFLEIRSGLSHKQGGSGAGLGLVLCKRFVELAGGTVGVSSVLGRGSCFWLQVPLQLPPTATTDRGGATIATRPDTSASAHNMASAGEGQVGLRIAPISAADPVADYSGQVGHEPPISSTPTLSPVSNMPTTDPAAVSRLGSPTPTLRVSIVDAPGRVSPDAGAASTPLESTAGRLRVITRAAVVDDSRTIRELFARQLQRSGCEVVMKAEHGQEALDELTALMMERSPLPATPTAAAAVGLDTSSPSARGSGPLAAADALVDGWFVDGAMPVMGGLELTRRLRGGGVRVPIVIVTGNALEEDRLQYLAAGANAVLAKPVTDLQLLLAAAGLRLPLENRRIVLPATAATATNAASPASPIIS